MHPFNRSIALGAALILSTVCIAACSDDEAPARAQAKSDGSAGGSGTGSGGKSAPGGAAGSDASATGGSNSATGGTSSQPDASSDGGVLSGNTVGPSGGTLVFAGGDVVFDFPAGAVDHDVSITVTTATPEPTRTRAIAGTEFVFGPEGTTFAKPVKVTMHYGALPQGVDANMLAIAKGVAAQWKPIHSSVDTQAQTVTASLQGFSPDGVVNIGFLLITGGCGLTGIGEVWCWGNGWTSGTDFLEPTKVSGDVTFVPYDAFGYRKLSASHGLFCGVSTTGETWCAAGAGSSLGATLGFSLPPTKVPGHVFFEVAVGFHSVCGITNDPDSDSGLPAPEGGQGGAVYCWGTNDRGELGVDPTAQNRITTTPIPVSGGISFSHVSIGGDFTCGISADAYTYCWGDEEFAQLGRGRGTFSSTPVQVAIGGKPLSLVTVSAGAAHVCGIDAGGSAVCWGQNDSGQIGDGTTDNHTGTDPNAFKLPTKVPGFSWMRLEAGGYVSCGVTNSADTYCWGQSEFIGDGLSHIPTDVQPTPKKLSVSLFTLGAGVGTMCGVTSSGFSYCWGGDNLDGDLGIGTSDRNFHTTPEKVKTTGLVP